MKLPLHLLPVQVPALSIALPLLSSFATISVAGPAARAFSRSPQRITFPCLCPSLKI